MTFTKNLSIGAKLGAAFLVVLVLLIGTAVAGLYQLNSVYGGTQVLAQRWITGIKLTSDIRHYVHSTRRAQLRLLPNSTPEEVATREKDIKRHAENMAKTLDLYAQLDLHAEEKALFEELKVNIGNIATGSSKLVDFMKAHEVRDEAQLYAANEALATIMGNAENSLKAIIQFNLDGAGSAEKQAAATYAAALKINTGLILVTMILVIALAVSMTRNITRPLHEVMVIMDKVGSGDLSTQITQDRQDELGALQGSLIKMKQSLRMLIGQVQESARSVTSVSSEIAMGNLDLSNRTEDSANSLQRTNSAISHLQEAITQSSQSAHNANALASSASEIAERGGRVVGEVVENMQTITASSRKISDIIGVIDGIAFQTNILALNAAVEAARAGEQGRGFAVVASEVRSLAGRSADAAKEIKQLINESVSNVEAGSAMVATAGSTIQNLVESVSQVSGIVAEIAQSAEAQRQEVSAISQSIDQLEQMTQQNAALVEESSAAADSLKGQASTLLDAISTFNAGDIHASQGPGNRLALTH